MCLKPIKLRTSSIYRSLNGYSKYYVEVPCGDCAECQVQKKNDWYLRNYFESQITWRDGGYILFDTLTMDDEHLSTISRFMLGKDLDSYSTWFEKLDSVSAFCDINNISLDEFKVLKILREKNYSCFDYTDVQKFLKRLRITLERAGYFVVGNLRYFLASEYGHDELYVDKHGRTRKGTSRPHYHVLFYVSGSLARTLSPDVLSQYISASWTLGRTDGVPYRDSAYVINHNTFGPKFITDPKRLHGVQYYVSKYVCKDYDFKDTVDSRVSYILTQVYRLTYDSPSYKEVKRKLHSKMDQFHRQSEGFGLLGFLVDSENWNYVRSQGKVKIPDTKDGVREYSIPMYYIRKIFQECVKDSEGRLHWVWNDLGKEWQKRRVFRNIDVLSQKMEDWFNNMSVYTDLDVVFRPKVENLLKGRSWRDYAEYIIVYRGRFCSNPSNPDTPEVVISSSLESPYSLESDKYFKRVDSGVYSYDGSIYSSSDLESSYVIDDSCLGGKYSGFDMISDIYHISMDSYNIKKQIKYEEDLRKSKRLKGYGLKPKK